MGQLQPAILDRPMGTPGLPLPVALPAPLPVARPLTAVVRMPVVDRLEPVRPVAAPSGRPEVPAPAHEGILLELEARHGQAMFGFVRRLGLSDSEASDAVQDVLLRLWTELERGTVVDDPRGWAFRAIYRRAMDEHRLRRRLAGLRERLMGRTTAEVGEDDFKASSDRLAVWAEVDRLPERQRQVLYLRYRADLPFEDIGEVLGISASAARSHATQAMAALRRRLGEGWDER